MYIRACTYGERALIVHTMLASCDVDGPICVGKGALRAQAVGDNWARDLVRSTNVSSTSGWRDLSGEPRNVTDMFGDSKKKCTIKLDEVSSSLRCRWLEETQLGKKKRLTSTCPAQYCAGDSNRHAGMVFRKKLKVNQSWIKKMWAKSEQNVFWEMW